MSNFSLKTENVCPIIIISKQEFIKWNQKQSTYVKSWVKANAFKGALFDVLSIPSDRGGIDMVLFGWGEPNDRLCDRFHFAKKIAKTFSLNPNLIQKISTKELNQSITRPLRLNLNLEKIKSHTSTKILTLDEQLDIMKNQLN